MKFGLALPYDSTRRILQWAQEAEERGWDGLFLGDAIWTEDPLIALAAAAVVTSRILLGVLVIPVPLRKPWKIASEALALDRLSDGRMTLGLGTGAVWMGWQSFPDEVTGNKARREMLDETIDILSLLFRSKPFDYEGNHYHIKLTLMDEKYYPSKPVQQPRIPLWTPAIWPGKKSLQRALKCDGVILEKTSNAGLPEEITPEDVRQVKEYIDENRPPGTPYDIVAGGKTFDLDHTRQRDKLIQLDEAGATWWFEGLWGEAPETVAAVIRQGPPAGN
jgi:alkanesulfonate monooxygenase SsuD/methylene tetrahydromethanopterin reductase-like flavin-dependent oxidoreductase (luciferase family)